MILLTQFPRPTGQYFDSTPLYSGLKRWTKRDLVRDLARWRWNQTTVSVRTLTFYSGENFAESGQTDQIASSLGSFGRNPNPIRLFGRRDSIDFPLAFEASYFLFWLRQTIRLNRSYEKAFFWKALYRLPVHKLILFWNYKPVIIICRGFRFAYFILNENQRAN